MSSASLRVGAIVLTLAVLLTGCAPTAPDDAVASPSASSSSSTPTPTPTPEVPQPAALLVSLDGLTVVDSADDPLSSVLFSDGDATAEFLTQLAGVAPNVLDQKQFGQAYQWADGFVVVNGGVVNFRFTAPTFGGLAVGTSQGIRIGSTRAEVLALGPVDTTYDGDGDGLPDSLGLEPRVVPGTPSLVTPGQEGVDYIDVGFTGDTVTSIGFGSDWRDI